MKTAPVTDLKNRLSHYLRLVGRGETVTVLDRGKPVAQLTPIRADDEELQRLAADGLVRLALEPVPKNFWTRPLPQSARSVSSALEEEREDRVR
jgi:prevent-host-death family protein